MNLLDLFSGIGGFHLGLEQAGFKFDWVGFSEVDKYATQLYKHQFPKSKELGDVTTIRPENLPKNIDILCGGFPCQTFSIAGKRAGFDDTRGTLFFEIARILRHFRDVGKPIPYFILENVKGLLNHDDGQTFATIYGVLADLDYTVECQLLNTKWFLPQNRERIYIVGHLGKRSGRKVFPIKECSGENKWNRNGGNTCTITNRYYTSTTQGSYINELRQIPEEPEEVKIADYRNDEGLRIRKDNNAPCLTSSHNSESELSRMQGIIIKEAAKSGYAIAEDGDSINLSVPNSKTRRGRGGKKTTQTLDTGVQQYTIDKSSIRRLTSTECERLQGFPDGWTDNNQSDTQRYKQLGNAVSVPVVKAVAEKIKLLIKE